MEASIYGVNCTPKCDITLSTTCSLFVLLAIFAVVALMLLLAAFAALFLVLRVFPVLAVLPMFLLFIGLHVLARLRLFFRSLSLRLLILGFAGLAALENRGFHLICFLLLFLLSVCLLQVVQEDLLN